MCEKEREEIEEENMEDFLNLRVSNLINFKEAVEDCYGEDCLNKL